MTPVEKKEELIQSVKKHYSDMLSQEQAPTQWHLDLFHRALDRGAERLAKEVTQVAIAVVERFGDVPIVRASLVRAGVPL
ncbi:cysteine protease StiP domain-containing protein, partial [Escherichia coli]